MPHRTNAELARMFTVIVTAQDAATVTLRFGIPVAKNESKTYLQAQFNRKSGPSPASRFSDRSRTAAGNSPRHTGGNYRESILMAPPTGAS